MAWRALAIATLFAGLTCTTTSSLATKGHPRPLDRLMGFGAGTTGAGRCARDGSCICHVTEATEAALRRCVTGDSPSLVVFDQPQQEITLSPLEIGSNKTIRGPASLTGESVLLSIVTGSNIIIRNVTFHNTLSKPTCAHPNAEKDVTGCGVGISIRNSARNIWIDHDEFYDCGDKCITIWPFLSDARNASGPAPAPDLITISNSIFRDSYYGILIGVDPHIPSTRMPEHERITLYGNLFQNVRRRSPQVQLGAWAHVFNNLITNWGGQNSCTGNNFGFGAGSNGKAQLRLEKNVFVPKAAPGACPKAIEISDYRDAVAGERGLGFVANVDNEANGAELSENHPEQVFDPQQLQLPSGKYRYALLPTNRVRQYVLANAGPR
jgi:pectate lyase